MKEIRPRMDRSKWSGKEEYRYYFTGGVAENTNLVELLKTEYNMQNAIKGYKNSLIVGAFVEAISKI